MGCTDGLYPTFIFNFTCFKYVKKGAVVVAGSMPLTMMDMGTECSFFCHVAVPLPTQFMGSIYMTVYPYV